MKKIISFTLVVTMLFACVAAAVPVSAEEYNGIGEDNLEWALDTNSGILTINGKGEMYNYYMWGSAPWFNFREHIKTLRISDGVTSIGVAAFTDCSNLENVILSKSVTDIEGGAFYGCSKLASITITEEVKNIALSAFEDCINFAYINADINNEHFSSEDGVLFSKDKTELIFCPAGNKRTTYNIPNGVVNIGDEAFNNCRNIKSVTIPKSLMSVGCGAFYGSGLTDVFYFGSENEWNKIEVCKDWGWNDTLTQATIHYNYKEPVHSVSGRIAGFGDINGTVTVELLSGGAAAYTATVENGVYSIQAAEPGTYTIRVSVDGRALYEDSLTVGGAGSAGGAVEKEVRLYTVGDADMDIGVSMKDVLIVRKYLLGTVDESAVNYKAACVENGETLSMKDALSIRKYLVGLIDKFPVEG